MEAETGRKKKQPSRGQVARMPGLFLTAALLAAIPGQTESLQLPRYPHSGHEVSGLGSRSRPSWADEFTRSCTAATDASLPWIHYADSCLHRELLPRPDATAPVLGYCASCGEGQAVKSSKTHARPSPDEIGRAHV